MSVRVILLPFDRWGTQTSKVLNKLPQSHSHVLSPALSTLHAVLVPEILGSVSLVLVSDFLMCTLNNYSLLRMYHFPATRTCFSIIKRIGNLDKTNCYMYILGSLPAGEACVGVVCGSQGVKMLYGYHACYHTCFMLALRVWSLPTSLPFNIYPCVIFIQISTFLPFPELTPSY